MNVIKRAHRSTGSAMFRKTASRPSFSKRSEFSEWPEKKARKNEEEDSLDDFGRGRRDGGKPSFKAKFYSSGRDDFSPRESSGKPSWNKSDRYGKHEEEESEDFPERKSSYRERSESQRPWQSRKPDYQQQANGHQPRENNHQRTDRPNSRERPEGAYKQRSEFRPRAEFKERDNYQSGNFKHKERDWGSDTKSSDSNDLLRTHFRQLVVNQKYRASNNSIVVTGLNALAALPSTSIKQLLHCGPSANVDLSCPVQQISSIMYTQITGEKNPNGVVAQVEAPPAPIPFASLEVAADSKKRWLGVYKVRDGANLGLLVRAVGCLGWDGVCVVGEGGTVDPFSLACIRASSGAVFKVPLYTAKSFSEITDKSVQVVLAEKPENVKISIALDYERPIMLVVGNEQNGFAELLEDPESVLKRATVKCADGFDSLNVALAGSILIHSINLQKL